jgi:hypothetical protein
MAGHRPNKRSQELFLRHLSLFTDKADDDGIYPRRIPGVDEQAMVKALTTFYSNVIVYDLTRQWIIQNGPFQYEYSWLSQKHSAAELAEGAKRLFASAYGVSPDQFKIIK